MAHDSPDRAVYPVGMKRREFLGLMGGLALGGALPAGQTDAIHIGLTPVILDDRVGFLRRWGQWLGEQLGRPVRFVQRAKYQDIMDLLDRGQLDAAWICGYPYVRHIDTLSLLATPVYKGEPLYHSLIITNRRHPGYHQFRDLAGSVFAFSDPLSNSGYLYPTYRLHQLFPHQERPQHRLFRRTFFTWGHRHVIEAVASGLADAGAVDGYVWEQLSRLHPELTSQTRIIERSPAFGFPPLVTTRQADPALSRDLGRVLTHMHEDARGRPLLESLGLDRFAFRTPKLYAGIALMASSVGDQLDTGA